jgi:hypothetical protein
MKKTYFEPETKVTEMFFNVPILEGTGSEKSDEEDDELGDNDFGGNKRTTEWGNLW